MHVVLGLFTIISDSTLLLGMLFRRITFNSFVAAFIIGGLGYVLYLMHGPLRSCWGNSWL